MERRRASSLTSATLKFRLSHKDGKKIAALFDAIKPESSRAHVHERCRVHCSTSVKGGMTRLDLVFDSKDIVSLRASANVNLRLIASALKTLDATALGAESLNKTAA
jgi:tRNA threonylcarbamoyladenosine modification (KEOPS) complex  Pcc1 subunit